MRGPHTNKKRNNSFFTRAIDHKLYSVGTLDEEAAHTKSPDTSTKWSRDKSKRLYLHFHKA